MNLRRVSVFIFAFATLANGLAKAAGTPAYGYDSNVPASWYFLLYDRVKAENLSPPVAARIFGATGVALYQAVQGGHAAPPVARWPVESTRFITYGSTG